MHPFFQGMQIIIIIKKKKKKSEKQTTHKSLGVKNSTSIDSN